MTLVSQVAANQPLAIVAGADFTWGLTITENSVAYPWSGAVLTSAIVDLSGTTVATNWTLTTGADGVLTATLSDTDTTALGVNVYRYWIMVTKAGITTPWLAGQLSVRSADFGADSNLTSTLTINTATTTVTIANSSPTASAVPITDAGGYYATNNVEFALQQVATAAGIVIADSGGLYTATEIEAALTEIATALNARTDLLTTGEATLARDCVNGNTISNGGTGVIGLTFFTAQKTETINNITVYTGTTAAAATPTLCRMGYFSVSGSTVTLLAACANDTTLFATTNTAYTRALTSGFSKVKGTRYAFGVLQVNAGAVATFRGRFTVNDTAADQAISARDPVLAARINAQTDFSVGATAFNTSTSARIFAVGTP